MAGHDEIFNIEVSDEVDTSVFETKVNPRGNNNFNDLIEEFSSSDDQIKQWYVATLEQLEKVLWSKNLSDVSSLLWRISGSNNYDEISRFISDLNVIANRYVDDAWNITREAREESGLFDRIVTSWRDVVETITPRVISDIELAEITWISINGSSSVSDLLTNIEGFKRRISRWEVWTNLTNKQREAIIEQLNQIVEWKENTEEIWHNQIESYFDSLAENITENNGIFEIEFDGEESKSFPTQQEALDFIASLKNTAETSFQSWLRTILEYSLLWAFNLLLEWESLAWSVPEYFIDTWSDFLTFDIFSLDNLFAIWMMLWGVAISMALLSLNWAVPIAIGSSIYRRLIQDNLQKLNSNLQYTDYARGQSVAPTDMSTPEGKDFMEMKQRQQIVDLLWADLETNYTQWSNEYNNYRHRIERIDSFKLNKTPTFYYLAYKYWKLTWKPQRWLFNITTTLFRGARFYYPSRSRGPDGKALTWLPRSLDYISIEDSKGLASQTITWLLDIEVIKNWIDLFYSNKTVNRVSRDREPPSIEVEWVDTKTDKYQFTINEINARNIPQDEKTKLIKKFEDYVKSLIDFPKTPQVIARDLHILLNTNYWNKADFLRNIDNRLARLKETNGRVSRLIWRVRSSEEVRLSHFKNILQNGQWVWSMREFDVEIQKIRTISRYRVSPNYSSRMWSVDFEQELDNIFKRGETDGRLHRVVLWEFYDNTKVWSGNGMIWTDFETSKPHQTPLMRGIIDYIDYWIHDDAREVFAKTELTELFDKIIAGDIMIEDENILFSEIRHIFDWYLPTYKVVTRLNNFMEANRNHANIDDIKALYEEAQKWNLNMTPEDMRSLERDATSFDYTTDRKRGIPVFEKNKIETLIRDTQGWRDFDYNRTFWLPENATGNDYLSKLTEKYSWELDIIRSIDIINNTTSRVWIITQLWEFSQALWRNRYSKWQADYILREIFTGSIFIDITPPMIWDAPDFYDGKSNFTRQLESAWNSLNDDEKIEKTKALKDDPNIDITKISITDIQATLRDLEWASEASNRLNRNIAEIERLTNQVKSASGEARLQTTMNAYNNYVSNPINEINIGEEPYRTLDTEFDDAFSTRERKLWINALTPTPERATTEPGRDTPEVQTPRSQTLLQNRNAEGLLNKAARDVVASAEFIMRANEFSSISNLTRITPEIEAQLRHLRDTGDLPDGTNIREMSIPDMRGALRTQLWLSELPVNINDAERIYNKAMKPDRDLRIMVETEIWNPLIDGEPRAWIDIYNDNRFMFIDSISDQWKASLDILRNPRSPAESIRTARITLETILRNAR